MDQPLGTAATTVTTFIERLNDPDLVVRIHAALSLSLLGAAAQEAVPALAAMLASGDVHDRKMATVALGKLGLVASPAVPLLCDPNALVRKMAAEALARIDAFNKEAA
jgi:HEAT repeat protein